MMVGVRCILGIVEGAGANLWGGVGVIFLRLVELIEV